MRYTGRTRRAWFFFTQYEYEFRGWVGGKWQTPYNSDQWPLCRAWTYTPPEPNEPRVADNDALRFVGDMQRLNLGRDDILVLSVDQHISYETAEKIRDQVKLALGEDRKVMILDAGMKAGVLARAA